MSWTKLGSAADWAAYKTRTAAELGVAGMDVRWGCAPAAYPCLAASTLTRENMRPDGLKVVTCFVLPADARELLGVEEGGGAAGKSVVEGPTAPRGSASDDTEFRRYVVAHLLTLVAELRSVSVTNPERYEEKFNAFLADVDQTTVSRAANVGPAAVFGRPDERRDD